MRRLGRWLWNGTTVLSLALSLAAATLWLRSCFASDRVLGTTESRLWIFSSGKGRFAVSRMTPFDGPMSEEERVAWFHETKELPDGPYPTSMVWVKDHGWTFLGIAYFSRPVASYQACMIAVPLAYFTVLFALAPSVRLYRWQVRRRRLPGCCVQCGYDLRATPDRCPECGAVPAAGKQPSR